MSENVYRMPLRSLRSSTLGVVAFVAAVLHPEISQGSEPFLTVPDPAFVATTAAYRYANMTNDEAIAEINRRNLPFVLVDPTPGVRAPIRLTGRLHGVLIHSSAAPNQRATSPFEILDARLALALDDFSATLEKHDIDEIEHFSMYRPEVAKSPVAAAKAKSVIVPAKPDSQIEKTDVGKSAETAQTKPMVVPAKPVSHLGKRGKPSTTKVANKRHVAATKPVIGKKPAPAPVVPEKPKASPPLKAPGKTASTNLGKAKLEPKTSAPDKPIKQKGADDYDDLVQPDKHEEVVGEVQPVSVVTTPAQTTTAAPQFGTRHPGGLAIDVGKLHKKDGTWITVREHFHGKIGDRACGPDASIPEGAEARELRALVCGAMDDHLFTYILTPNYNAAHYDHFHIEVKPGVKWFFVH